MKTTVFKDAMGMAISDFWKTSKAEKLIVYSDLTEPDEIPVPYLFREFNKMPVIEQKALEVAKGKVLDVGSAAAAHALYLVGRGFDVTAIDISGLSVEVALARGVLSAKCIDFFDMPSTEKFDTILFLMNGVGIAGTLPRLKVFLEKCRNLLTVNGQILLDSSDLSYMYDNGYPKPDDKYFGEVSYIMKYGKITTDPFHWLFIDFETLKLYANQCGFNCIKLKDGHHFDFLAKLSLK